MNIHEHILSRFSEDLGLTPNAGVSTMAGDVSSGQSSSLALQTKKEKKKEGDEFKPSKEEKQELKIADAILKAASGLSKSPATEEIIRQAEELKRMHGIK